MYHVPKEPKVARCSTLRSYDSLNLIPYADMLPHPYEGYDVICYFKKTDAIRMGAISLTA